jgi:AraC-like DNA-binding protein
MQHLPEILCVRRNSGPTVSGSFIDEGWVWHFVAAGAWEFRMGGRAWSVQPGDSVLIPPRLVHGVTSASPGENLHEVILFNLGEMYTLPGSAFVVTLPAEDQARVRRWFAEIAEAWDCTRVSYRARPGRALETHGLLAAILGAHLRCHGRDSAPGSEAGWPEVEAAVRHVQKHYARPGLTLREISRAAGITPNYLCRVFPRHMGCTVMDYLAEHRLEHAEELLLNSVLNVSQIAEKVGFSGLHVFSRTFRRRRRCSPTEYRVQHAPRLRI